MQSSDIFSNFAKLLFIEMKQKTKKRLIITLWVIVFAPILALITFIVCVGLFAGIPSFEELEDPKTYLATELISEDGQVIATYHIEKYKIKLS